MKELITMKSKELERVSVLNDLLNKRIKQKHAASLLLISTRQVRRLVKRYRRNGAGGLVHLARGKQGNRAISQTEKDRVADLVRDRYSDFGPTLAHEKLVENHGVTFGVDTLRQEMIKAGIWKAKRRKVVIPHLYRQRRACFGELVQLDGSPHHWFENRCEACTLIAFIDDATSKILSGEFVDHEGTFALPTSAIQCPKM